MKDSASTTRREFLGFAAGAAAGLALTGLPAVRSKRRRSAGRGRGPGVERFVPTTCLLCPAACGIVARVVDGRVVKLEGNPLHPVNRGRLCAVGQAGLHVLCSPDRAGGPMRRIGPRGSGRFEPVSWEEAIAEVAAKLGPLREGNRSDAVAALDGHGRGLMAFLLDRFLGALHSSQHLLDVNPDGAEAALDLAQGVRAAPGFDLERAAFVFAFGAPLFEAWWSPVFAQRVFGRSRRGEEDRRPRLAVADSRFGRTAAKADEWIPVRPGGFGALALAIAYVLVREDLYDRAFVERHTFGFDSWRDPEGVAHAGFRDYLLQNCRPDALAAVSGVPVETVLRVGKEFASNRPAVAIAGHGATLSGNGAANAFAIHALNALVGGVDRPGGVLTPPALPVPKWPPIVDDPAESAGDGALRFARAPLDTLPERLLSAPEGRLEALFLYGSDPLFSLPDPDRFARALARVPFVVDFSPFPDDTTPYADLWLPDATYLERWQDGEAVPAAGLPVFGLVQPATALPRGAMHAGDFLLRVAKAMGEGMERALPWDSVEALVRERAQALFESQRGTTFVPAREESQIRELERRGWWLPSQRTFEEFWAELRRSGGWWDPAYPFGEWGRVFRTPSRRFEFYSTRLRDAVEREAGGDQDGIDPARRAAVLGRLGITALGDEAFLPHLEAPRAPGSEEGRTLALVPFRAHALSCGDHANLPWLQDVGGVGTAVPWETWVEIHPDAARDLGVEDGMRVVLESATGAIRAIARLTRRIQPEVAAVLYGLGHRGGGRYARGRGENPNRLIQARPEPIAGLRDWTTTRVRIRPEGVSRA